MIANAWLQLGAYLVLLAVLAVPIGYYVANVLEGRRTWLSPVLEPIERGIYRLTGVDAAEETGWKPYAYAMLAFNAAGFLAVYLLQRLQALLPLNPQHFPGVTPDSSFNTAVSFATNTNWQGYGGETTMSMLTQMLALAVQNFVSAATGIAVMAALIRGFARQDTDRIGNFWVDLTRSTVHVLLPLSLVLAVALVGQGVPQTFHEPARAALVRATASDSGAAATQLIPLGPVASQIAIKQLGTNGGGYYNVNSSHPLENPTPFSNLLECLAILALGAALCFTFGRMVRDMRQGGAIFAAMTIIFVAALVVAFPAEQAGNPRLAAIGADIAPGAGHPGGNMEGKEARFGIASSALWAVATTSASNGSVNSMHDSYTPIGGLVPMLMMQLGEVVYGGVGSGLYGMLAFALVAVFIAGLMVGRTPEYLGKKIGAFEVKMASIVILVPPILVLAGTAIAVVLPAGLKTLQETGPHGFSEALYAFSSASNNNGSAFAGLGANTPFYNLALGIAMLMGRYALAVPILAMAGALAKKRRAPAGPGTLPTHDWLFVLLVVAVVLIVGALTFLPALSLGPILEHVQLNGGVR